MYTHSPTRLKLEQMEGNIRIPFNKRLLLDIFHTRCTYWFRMRHAWNLNFYLQNGLCPDIVFQKNCPRVEILFNIFTFFTATYLLSMQVNNSTHLMSLRNVLCTKLWMILAGASFQIFSVIQSKFFIVKILIQKTVDNL